MGKELLGIVAGLAVPISQAEIEARISGHLDELLELWWAEQGVSKPRDLQLIARRFPFHATRPFAFSTCAAAQVTWGALFDTSTRMRKSTGWIETRS
jgi:hypothetical protein